MATEAWKRIWDLSTWIRGVLRKRTGSEVSLDGLKGGRMTCCNAFCFFPRFVMLLLDPSESTKVEDVIHERKCGHERKQRRRIM